MVYQCHFIKFSVIKFKLSRFSLPSSLDDIIDDQYGINVQFEESDDDVS